METSPEILFSKASFQDLQVLHLFSQFHSIGGVESFLKLHYQFDDQLGVLSDFIIYLEDPQRSHDRVHCLGISPSDSLRTVTRKLRQVTESRPNRIALYHLPWAGPYFCPHDRSSRRIFVFHSNSETAEPFLLRSGHFFDGFLCVNPLLRDIVRNCLPRIPPERIQVVQSPIAPPAGSCQIEELRHPLQLGYVGRLDVKHKRIDRIPEFCSNLQSSQTPFILNLIGDGPQRDLLENSPSAGSLRFTGVLQGNAYWNAVSDLDFIIFFSDLEGTPMALIEALSQGVIPVFPKINCGADDYVRSVSEELLYPPGDLQTAASIISRISRSSREHIAALRQRSRAAVQHHSVANYLPKAYSFVKSISDLPRISDSSPGFSMLLAQFFTINQITKARDLWRRVKGR